MKYFLAFLLSAFLFQAQAQTDQKEIPAIQQVLSYYLDGGSMGDSIMFSKAFLPEGQMMYMRNDTLNNVSLESFMKRIRHTGQKQDRKTRIETIQVYGNVASAKLTIEYPTFYFHDIMSLVKTAQGWKIVGKIFYRENK